MPITIKTGAMKYKKPNGEYDGFNAIAQESTDQQLASIQAAGVAQVSAVQQKGVETLESIPDDYTDLSGNVADLKSAFAYDDMIHNMEYPISYVITDAEVEIGAINGKGNIVNNNRTRVKGYYHVNAGDKIIIGASGKSIAGSNINVWYFDENKNYISTSSWYNVYTEITIEANGYVRFLGSTASLGTLPGNVAFIFAEKTRAIYNDVTRLDRLNLEQHRNLTLTSAMVTYGYIDGGNGYKPGANRCVTKYIRCNDGDLVMPVRKPGFRYVVTIYDLDKTYIFTSAYMTVPYRINGDCYVRITMDANNNSTISDLSIVNGAISIISQTLASYNTKYFLGQNNAREYTSTVDDLAIGSYVAESSANYSGIDNRTDRMRITKPFVINRGDIIRLNYRNVLMAVQLTDENGNRTYSPWYSKNYIGGGKTGDYIAQGAGYACLYFYVVDDSLVTITDLSDKLENYPGLVTVIHGLSYTDKMSYQPCKMINKRAVVNRDMVCKQDGCAIGNRLWLFGDGANVDGAINIYNDNYELVGTKTHRLGHCNSVSYDKNVDAIVTFGTDGTSKPTIVIYQHPENHDTLITSDTDCTVIRLYNDTEHMNVSASLCWGENSQTIYYIDGVYSDMSNGNVRVENYNIYKIQLGLGDNDLSSNGYGVFVSGKSDTEYNGTCRIIATYTGALNNGADTIEVGNSLPTPQGMEFDGYIYLGWGTRGHNFLKIELDDYTGTYRAIENYLYHDLDANGAELYYEPEMITFFNGKMITGSVGRSDGGSGQLVLIFGK